MKRNFSLGNYNSFGVKHKANFFIEIKNKDQINDIINNKKYDKLHKLILGGGSNILFTKDYNGIVFLNKIKGIRKISEDDNNVLLRVGSGENWDDLVEYCVKKKYYGLENLSLIPGSVGAAPIQNIGAYGVEVKNLIENVEGIFLDNGIEKKFNNKSCEFQYRDSIFKGKLKNKFFITSVDFVLSKIKSFNISYRDLKYLDIKNISLNSLRNEIIKIRNSKLPDPRDIGNAGSFFKNPLVDRTTIDKIKNEFNDLVYFKDGDKFKIPAAWLIEKCGWKGYKENNIGVSDKHALVIVNYNAKKGKEIKELSKKIIDDVKGKFRINLIPEVNVI
tara:strand:- start:31266 stop:32261 length:996 start_codon:yes stop_codon:yes gene_type:complete